MLKACLYCGRVHDSKHDCGKRPPKRYKRRANEAGRYTEAWKRKSEAIKAQANYLCEYCRDEGVFTYNDLETHHIVKLRERPDLLLEGGNLICLCRRHHEMAENGTISVEKLRGLAAKRDRTIPPTP